MKTRIAAWIVAIVLVLAPGAARATPSTTYWTPVTPYVQPFGVLHVTYDTYFRENTMMPVDLGLTVGLLPWDKLQLEAGFDFFLPTFAGDAPLDAPVVLNAKIGAPEDAYFQGAPGWSAGIWGVGFKKDVTDMNILHLEVAKTFDYVGTPEVGVYYGLNEDLFLSSEGKKRQLGLMAGWFSPAIDVPLIDKAIFTWDIQTGQNVLGATGGGVYLFFTPAISLLTGPVWFLDNDLQADNSSWLWTMQLDIDVDVFSTLKGGD